MLESFLKGLAIENIDHKIHGSHSNIHVWYIYGIFTYGFHVGNYP